MSKRLEATIESLKPIIRFHWKKSRLKKKTPAEGTEKAVYKPVCEIPPSRSIIKNAHSQGGEIAVRDVVHARTQAKSSSTSTIPAAAIARPPTAVASRSSS